MAPALQADRFRNGSDSALPDRANIARHRRYAAGQIRFLHPNYDNPDGATSVSAGGLMLDGRSARVGRRVTLSATAIRAA
jgi:hypothetical protein